MDMMLRNVSNQLTVAAPGLNIGGGGVHLRGKLIFWGYNF